MARPRRSGETVSSGVPPVFTRALLAQARARDCDVDALLRRARCPRDPLRRDVPMVSVSREQYSRLCLELFRELGDESGGVMPDAQTPPGTTRLMALSMLGSGNLAAALARAIEFNACCRVRPGARVRNELTLDDRGRQATLSYLCADDCPEKQHLVLCHIAMWLRLCGWLIGQPIDVTSASCAGPAPVCSAGIRHFFPGPVRFDGTLNSVTFSARHLEAEIIRDEAQLESFLELAPYHIVIEPLACEVSVGGRIRKIIGVDFRREMPSFEELTGLLNMSARTLRRRLEREGTSYQRIKDTARRDIAISLLCRDGLTVSEVAEQVGFSDPSAFHRSFKKWTGHSPGSYR